MESKVKFWLSIYVLVLSLIIIASVFKTATKVKVKDKVLPVKERHLNVDFSKSSKEKRLCVMEGNKKIYCTWVAHGKNSGGEYAKSFSNVVGSNKSSLGKYKIGETYQGKYGLSYKLDGLEKGVNDNLRKRAVVIHSSDYIGKGKTGRSLGCLAIPIEDKKDLFKLLKPGMIINVYN